MNKALYIKIVVSQAVAFGIATFLVNNVFLGSIPIIRSDVQENIVDLPKNAVNVVKTIGIRIKDRKIIAARKKQAGSQLPPPWIFKDIPTPTSTQTLPQRQNPTQAPEATSVPDPTTAPPQPSIPKKSPPTSSQDSILTDFPREQQRPTEVPSDSGKTSGEGGNVELEIATVAEINRRRKELGLAELTVDNELTQAARRHSADMSSHNDCGHTGSDGSDPISRAKDARYTGQAYGETVSCWATTAVMTVSNWWGSPPHKAILTNAKIREIGLGWVKTHQTALVGL